MNNFLNGLFLKKSNTIYLAASCWNTFFGLTLLYLLYYLLNDKLHYFLIFLISHLLSIFNSWLIYRFLIFRSCNPWFYELIKHSFLSIIIYFIQLFGVIILIKIFDFQPLYSQFTMILITFIIGFIINNKYIFLK